MLGAAVSSQHFIDLCRMLGYPTPNEADATGDHYAFEKGATKSTGDEGFADVLEEGPLRYAPHRNGGPLPRPCLKSPAR